MPQTACPSHRKMEVVLRFAGTASAGGLTTAASAQVLVCKADAQAALWRQAVQWVCIHGEAQRSRPLRAAPVESVQPGTFQLERGIARYLHSWGELGWEDDAPLRVQALPHHKLRVWEVVWLDGPLDAGMDLACVPHARCYCCYFDRSNRELASQFRGGPPAGPAAA